MLPKISGFTFLVHSAFFYRIIKETKETRTTHIILSHLVLTVSVYFYCYFYQFNLCVATIPVKFLFLFFSSYCIILLLLFRSIFLSEFGYTRLFLACAANLKYRWTLVIHCTAYVLCINNYVKHSKEDSGFLQIIDQWNAMYKSVKPNSRYYTLHAPHIKTWNTSSLDVASSHVINTRLIDSRCNPSMSIFLLI